MRSSRAMLTLAVDEAWSLLSPEPAEHLDAGKLTQQAKAFFATDLVVSPRDDSRPGRVVVLADGAALEVVTAPLADAPLVLEAAHDAVRAIGGAGMDALVARARRVWQVRGGATDANALLVAAVLASTLLAPIVPPGGGAIFGVRGARERLEALGWREGRARA